MIAMEACVTLRSLGRGFLLHCCAVYLEPIVAVLNTGDSQRKKLDATQVTLLSLVSAVYRESYGSVGAHSIVVMITTKRIKLSRWRAVKLMEELNIISCLQPWLRYKKAFKENIEIPIIWTTSLLLLNLIGPGAIKLSIFGQIVTGLI